MLTTLPTLSADGWVIDDIGKKLDYAIAHFFASEYSQSYSYHGKISSMPYILQVNTNNSSETITDLKRTLDIYLGRLFNSSTVEISNVTKPTNSSKISLSIYIEVEENGRKANLSKLLQENETKTFQVIDLNNG